MNKLTDTLINDLYDDEGDREDITGYATFHNYEIDDVLAARWVECNFEEGTPGVPYDHFDNVEWDRVAEFMNCLGIHGSN